MRPLVALVGCAIFMATTASGSSSIADRRHEDRRPSTPSATVASDQTNTLRYVRRSQALRRLREGGSGSRSDAGGQADTRAETPVVVESDANTDNGDSGSPSMITFKNGGTTWTYEFTTPGGPSGITKSEVGADSNVDVDEEDVVDILTTATAAPSTASPTPAPSTAEPSPSPTDNPTAEPSPSPTSEPTRLCGMSSFHRRVALMLMATQASGNLYYGTPHKAALEWLVEADGYQVCPDDPNALQRYTLAVFYYSTLGDDWLDCSATPTFAEDTCDSVRVGTNDNDDSPKISGDNVWLSPVHECMWAGVQCIEETKSIDRLEFEGNRLAGSLPTELGHLTELRFFYAEQGNIGGTIPTELGQLSNLLVLDLDYNYLTGEAIPAELYNLSNLAQLDLNHNLLTGTIDSAIGDLKDLQFLQLGNNPITGTIPEELGNLNLNAGGFENTLLTGTMPSGVCADPSPSWLVADCAGETPRLVCECCGKCLETDQLAESDFDGR